MRYRLQISLIQTKCQLGVESSQQTMAQDGIIICRSAAMPTGTRTGAPELERWCEWALIGHGTVQIDDHQEDFLHIIISRYLDFNIVNPDLNAINRD